MGRDIKQFEKNLLNATDGSSAWKSLDSLIKASKTNPQALKVLAFYVENGSIDHIRESSISILADLIDENDTSWIQFFRNCLNDPKTRYWAIPGYLKTAGVKAYPDILKLALDPRIPTIERAKAIKCLAISSKQPFDRELPPNSDNWKQDDLRIEELQAWAGQGFPIRDVSKYEEYQTHPALIHPKTQFEKIVAQLDRKLAKKRQNQGLEDNYNLLTLGSSDDLNKITTRWQLPEKYLDFLTRFSPLNVELRGKKFADSLELYGASNLIKGQEGYSFNPVTNQLITDWPSEFIVIGNDGGDPYVINLLESDGSDAPIYKAAHGRGRWDFERVFPSFEAFLKWLS